MEIKETCTTMYGPFWSYFLMVHYVEVNDVVTLKLPDEDGITNDIDEEDVQGMEFQEEITEDVSEVNVGNHANQNKPFQIMHGMFYFNLLLILLVAYFCSLFLLVFNDTL
jgi:hypothetical protein